MKKIFLINIFIFFNSLSQIGVWKSFTNMSDVKKISLNDDTVFAATSGGIFLFIKSENRFVKFTNADGLSSNSITSILLDSKKNIWVGHSNGKIDIFNQNNFEWKSIKDIFLSNKNNKEITNFYSIGDTILISTSFGISRFNINKFEFGDTYLNFANLSQPKITSSVLMNNRIFALTENSLLFSKQNAGNLISPDAWQIGLTNIKPIGVEIFNNQIYCAEEKGLYKFENESWIQILGINSKIISVTSNKNYLYLIHSNGYTSISVSNQVTFNPLPEKNNIVSAKLDSKNNLVIGASDGISFVENNMQQWEMKTPNSPASNIVADVVVDKNGSVWISSGISTGKGFAKYDGVEWRNFFAWNYTNMPSNFVFKIIVAPDNSKLVATHGKGIVKINSEDKIEKIFNNTNPGFIGVASDQKYVIPTGMAFDKDGNFWTTIYQANNHKILWKLNKIDSSWESFYAPEIDNYTSQMNLEIDRNGTKWFGSALNGYVPLKTEFTFFNEKLNIANSTDNWGILTTLNGITSNQINDLVIDKNDEVWAATTSGITIIRDLQNPFQRIGKVYNGAVRDLPINSIKVDPLNNKWLGTQKGVFVLSPDGNLLLAHYDVENTNGKLINNEIYSIAFDEKKGIVYFGTASGLSSLTIETIKPESDFSNIKVTPNPFLLNKNSHITINGLVENSTINIYSNNNVLIKSFAAQGGGRAFWDGLDKNNKQVASGIYYIVAYSENDNKIAKTKLAIIKNK